MTRRYITLMAFAICTTLALIAIGIWHHAQPTARHANWQLARINVAETMDAAQLHAAKALLRNEGKVSHVYYNPQSNALVVGLDCTGPEAKEKMIDLVTSMQADLNLDATLYEADPERLSSGCPITGQKGIIPRAKNFFASIF